MPRKSSLDDIENQLLVNPNLEGKFEMPLRNNA